MSDNQVVAQAEDPVGEGQPTGEFYTLSDEELAARDKRNLAVAFSVVAFVVIVFATTMLRLMQNVGGATT